MKCSRKKGFKKLQMAFTKFDRVLVTYAAVIGVAVVLCSMWLLLCLWRRTSFRTIADENSSLLSSSAAGTYFQLHKGGYDHALMSCQYYIRDNPGLEFLQPYKPTDKSTTTHWFLVRDSTLPDRSKGGRKAVVKVVHMAKKPPVNIEKEGTIATMLDMLLTVKGEACPFIWPVLDLRYQPERGNLLIVTKYSPEGSARDRMLRVKPFHHFQKTIRLKKSYEFGKPLSLEKICAHTKQVLLGLIFFDKLGYPLQKTHCWLHAGNILVEDGICKLSGYEVELLRLQPSIDGNKNVRAGLNSVAQLVFELATGFPVNYADHVNLNPSHRRLTIRKKEALREIHFEYLNKLCKHEVLQLLQFLCDEDKCTSLHMSVHHPFFDQITRFSSTEPEPAALSSIKTLRSRLHKSMTPQPRVSQLKTDFTDMSKIPGKCSTV